MAILFVGAGSTYSRSSNGTGYTLNIPTVQAGDLLIALVAFYPGSSASLRTVTAPAGWSTKINVISIDADTPAAGDRCQMAVLYKVATGSEPATYTDGSIGSTVQILTTGVVAYRGVQGFGATSYYLANQDQYTGFSPGTVNNTSASNWRAVMASYVSGTANYDLTANEVSRRFLVGIDDEVTLERGVMCGAWDSNATVAAGNHSRTVSKSNEWAAAAGFIFILEASTGIPASGTWASTLGKLTATAAGDVHDDGVMAGALPSLSSAFTGLGTPPVVTGDLAASLAPVSAAAEGGTDVSGAMAAAVLPLVSIQGETRVFGIRVILTEPESRVIVVPSRGVDD
jgi:hypothetical protein